jgi:hypothetical protein
MADGKGKEYRVPLKEIAANRGTGVSTMPASFGELLSDADTFHLLDQLPRAAPKK